MSESNTVASPADDANETPPLRAKHLGLRLPVVPDVPEVVPARMINEVLYCERLFYLEWAQGEFDDNWYTVEGRAVHRRPDKPGGELPPKPGERAGRKSKKADSEDNDTEPVAEVPEPPPYEARSVWLSSERLGITAKIDIVEGDGSGRVLPIEYKRGKAPDLPEGAYLPERAQICAQVLLLREHGYVCDEGAIYFAGSKKRVGISIDESLVQTTLEAVRRARALGSAGVLPPPLVDSPKCNGCSLVGICLPDETNLLRRLESNVDEVDPLDEPVEEPARPGIEDDLTGPLEHDPWGLADPVGQGVAEIRRLHPARDDKVPLYVQSQGARIGLSGERLAVTSKEGATEARLTSTSQVCVMGNVQVSTQALKALLDRAIPVAFFTTGGYYIGRACGYSSKNVELRMAQYAWARDKLFCSKFARGVVAAKIRNGRTMLRRNHGGVEASVLFELEQLAKKAEKTEDPEGLLGIEGTAARIYFAAFAGMIKGASEVRETFDWAGRNRRPPRDPLNALLSLAYSLLSKEFALALEAVGLDPMMGFYHRPRFGRPALALDLMEEMRPIVADSAVITAINNGVVGVDDFVRAAGSVALTPEARKRFIVAYERRMDQLVTHPIFGYRLSYRRLLEVQARLLGRVLLGEIESYPSFRTR
ncbi:MAG: CRISPR-associated endonuclease Cas1 [Polyangiaceae bacterium]|nr:CRISPR-associated endonuclease Cas1 [Polyangiaceae bacterium]